MTGLLKRRVFPGNRNHIPLRNPWDYHSNDMKKPTIWLSLKYLIYFFYIRKTIQLSMTRIYEEKRDISKHRKLKNKTNTTFFWYNNKKKRKTQKKQSSFGWCPWEIWFFLGGVNLQTALATMNAINAYY